MADGKFANLLHDDRMAASIPYYQDKLIWCIPHAQKYPIFINFFFIIPIEMWIFIICVGFVVVSILIYFLLPFDDNYGRRIEHYDGFYCFLQVVVLALTGNTAQFEPKNFKIRCAYWLLLMCPMLFHMMIGAFLFNFMNYQFYYYQISTVDEMVAANFRLTGSKEVVNIVEQDSKVTWVIPENAAIKYVIDCFLCSTRKKWLKIFMYATVLMCAWNTWSALKIMIWPWVHRNYRFSIHRHFHHHNIIASVMQNLYWLIMFRYYWKRTTQWRCKSIELFGMHSKLVYCLNGGKTITTNMKMNFF